MRILLVEDEPEMAAALVAALLRHDIDVDHAPTLAFAREAIANGVHDAVLIDRQLPDGDGVDLIPLLSKGGRQVPSIVISALGATDQRIRSLDEGADDYLPKPFAVDELLARLRAVLRRRAEVVDRFIEFGALRYNTQTRQVSATGRELVLTRRELFILERLIRRPGQTVSRRGAGRSRLYLRRRNPVELAGSQYFAIAHEIGRRPVRRGDPQHSRCWLPRQGIIMSTARPSLRRRIILSVVLLNIATFLGLPAMMMLVAYVYSPEACGCF